MKHELLKIFQVLLLYPVLSIRLKPVLYWAWIQHKVAHQEATLGPVNWGVVTLFCLNSPELPMGQLLPPVNPASL